MTMVTQQGAPQFPTIEGHMPASTQENMDTAIQTLQDNKDIWVAISPEERVHIIDVLINDVVRIGPRWVAASGQAKGVDIDSPLMGEEWGTGPYVIVKTLRQLRQSLLDITQQSYPHIPGPVTTRPDGQVIAQVFPQSTYDKIFFSGLTAEIWMEPGVTIDQLPHTQAMVYQHTPHPGKVALVLGAGNVSSIAPTDVLYKLFVEDQVVILKMNPVNAYLGPLIEEGFKALCERGVLRITYGGAQEGAYLCNHPDVDEIHITGSDKTFDAIVFGTGEAGAQRKATSMPLIQKRVTGELGNVSPFIVVPGPWSQNDLTYQAEHIVSSLVNNVGFNCNATRVIITDAGWSQRTNLLQQIRATLGKVTLRSAYYPGAQQRHQMFLQAHPEAELIGTPEKQQLPWTLIPNLNPEDIDDLCYTTEAFCGIFGETALHATDTAAFIDQAVEFANEHLWGTLNITLVIHPASLKDPAVAETLERAVANLRYGTIGINYWAGVGFALGSTSWGAFPGHYINDIQSGTGVVHNTLMFDRLQKSVVRAPFRSIPTPPWFITQASKARKIFPKLVRLEASPSPWKVPGILWSALGG